MDKGRAFLLSKGFLFYIFLQSHGILGIHVKSTKGSALTRNIYRSFTITSHMHKEEELQMNASSKFASLYTFVQDPSL